MVAATVFIDAISANLLIKWIDPRVLILTVDKSRAEFWLAIANIITATLITSALCFPNPQLTGSTCRIAILICIKNRLVINEPVAVVIVSVALAALLVPIERGQLEARPSLTRSVSPETALVTELLANRARTNRSLLRFRVNES